MLPGPSRYPSFRRLFRAREVSAVDVDVLEIVRCDSSDWIAARARARALRPTGRCACKSWPCGCGPARNSVAPPSTCSNAAIASACWKFFAGLHRIQDAGPVPLGHIRVQRQGATAVLLRLVEPRAVAHRRKMNLHGDVGEPGVGERELRDRARRRRRDVPRRSAACPVDRRRSRASRP